MKQHPCDSFEPLFEGSRKFKMRSRLVTVMSVVAAMAAVGGCASPDEGVDRPSMASRLGSRLKDGVLAMEDAVTGLPRVSRIVYASERCRIADDGDAECGDAALRTCRARGFESGRALDTASVNSCRPSSLHQLQSGDGQSCKTKYQLTAALCW